MYIILYGRTPRQHPANLKQSVDPVAQISNGDWRNGETSVDSEAQLYKFVELVVQRE